MAHTISSADLQWHADDRLFTEEASALLMLPGLPMPRVIEVVSAMTGAKALFELSATIKTPRNAFLGGWFYAPKLGCANAAKTRGIKIWND